MAMTAQPINSSLKRSGGEPSSTDAMTGVMASAFREGDGRDSRHPFAGGLSHRFRRHVECARKRRLALNRFPIRDAPAWTPSVRKPSHFMMISLPWSLN